MMPTIDEFFDTCYDNKVEEVRRMISEGVDINGGDIFGRTGLILAMGMGNIEVTRILLGCNDIKLYIKEKRHGATALHAACHFNRIECVKLFLQHPSCNKNIVRMKDNCGVTAEMMAYKEGNKECAKLIKEYYKNNDDRKSIGTIKEDARSVDDFVEFITGVKTEKKNPAQSISRSLNTAHCGETNIKTEDIGGMKNKISNRTESKNDSGTVGTGVFDTIVKDDTKKYLENSNNKKVPGPKYKRATLQNIKEDLKKKIAEKGMEFDAHKKIVKDKVDKKSIEIKNLNSMMEKSQDEKNMKLIKVNLVDNKFSDYETRTAHKKSSFLFDNNQDIKEEIKKKFAICGVDLDTNTEMLIDTDPIRMRNSMIEMFRKEVHNLDNDMSDLKTRMAVLKLGILEQIKIDDKCILKYKKKKQKLHDDIEKELDISKEKGKLFTEEIQDLETKLQETINLIKNLPDDEKLLYEPNKELFEFIQTQIIEKEKELECPVCLDVASSPIFMCSEQHLICSTCRPKLSNCPECRVGYYGKNRRHRYAEKTAEELKRLIEKKEKVKNYYC